MTRSPSEYFDSILWPAAAGNVAWSILTLVLSESADRPSHLMARIAILVVLAAYLSLEWLRRPATLDTKKQMIFSGLHVATISALAIATAIGRSPEFLAWTLAVLLSGTCIGHLVHTWEKDRTTYLLATSNAAGIAVLIWCSVLRPALPEALWPVPVAALVVLLAWGCVRVICGRW